ncbi:hypothetical protein NQ318_022016 [Aromia moschata]|uniref:GPN-loop GTPase 2 n=1 Tax=Aromia moschata TaxID=1265417 RepID=A0AAV8Z538_9CUCU|nr:hypothetical protein NQ318_022016 [Aromia moschata]
MDLETSLTTLSLNNSPSNVNSFAVSIRGNHTEIVLSRFTNYINLIITQFEKIGNLYQIKVDQPDNGFVISDPIYTITTVLGRDNLEAEVAARYLTEKLKIRKPLLLSLSLKDFSKSTLNCVIELYKTIKTHSRMALVKRTKKGETHFGQIVIGPPGSGKTTYCGRVYDFYKDKLNRKVEVVNLDPANENMNYNPKIDVMKLITAEDVMRSLNLGPNGALMYCMEYLEENFDWLLCQLLEIKDSYLIFDMPGQVELYTHHGSIKNIFEKLEKLSYHLCAVHMVDSHYCSDPPKFISTLLLSLSTMMQIALPHVNVLSKANGYIYGSGEERSMQALLSCAVGARTESERFDADYM